MSDLIVFGYGSLIFKPPPRVVSQVSGYLKGYVRRFAQSSSDHRGTPEHPGRVVTLVHRNDWAEFRDSDPFPEDEVVWGVAYIIDHEFVSEVQAYLDYREKDGYTVERTDVYGLVDGKEQIVAPQAIVYVGRKDNPSFVGFESLSSLSQHIWGSLGPSGSNKEYVYKLADAVRALAPDSYDSHLYTLEGLLRELDKVESNNYQ